MHANWPALEAGEGPRRMSLACEGSARAITDAILEKGAFTAVVADRANLAPADYVGIVSANREPDKIGKAGWTVERGEQGTARAGGDACGANRIGERRAMNYSGLA